MLRKKPVITHLYQIFFLTFFTYSLFPTYTHSQASKREIKQLEKKLQPALEDLFYFDYHSAIEKLVPIYQEYPTNVKVNYLLGHAYFEAGKPTTAEKYFEYAFLNRNKDPYFKDTILLSWYYGKILLLAEKPGKAKTIFLTYQKQVNSLPKRKAKRFHKAHDLALYLAYCDNAQEMMKNPRPVLIKNLGPTLNSPYPEYAPIVDGTFQHLAFTTRRPGNLGDLSGDGLPYEDIYISENIDGKWSDPRPVKNVNTKFHEATVFLSYDGKRMYIYKHEKGLAGDIYVSEYQPDGNWGVPKRLPEPINSKYFEPSICESADGKYLFFVSDRPGGLGGTDIYYVEKRSDGTWSEPVNLGAPINSPYDEDAPLLLPDGKTFYFASNRPTSMGGYDTYRSTWLGGNQWTEPQNLGYPLNTPGDDIYMVISADEKYGYFASHRADSYGDKDLYFIDFKPEIKKDTLKPQPIAISKLVLHFYDQKTGQPISPNVRITTPKVVLKFLPSSFSETGTLIVPRSMLPDQQVELIATLPQYEMKTVTFNLPSESTDSIFEYKVYLTPLEMENPSRNLLVTIYFDFDKYNIRQSEIPKMEKVIQILKQNPYIYLSIEGHTDVRGSEQYNLILSKRRAISARDYLIEKGISPRRLDIKYYGESKPVDHSNTPQGHQRNRRVEFIILEE